MGLSEEGATVCGFALSAAKYATVLLLLSQARCNVLSPFSELVLILQNFVNFSILIKIKFSKNSEKIWQIIICEILIFVKNQQMFNNV